MKNIKSKLLLLVIVMFSFTFLFSIDKTKAIYRESKTTSINLTVVDSSNAVRVRFYDNDGSGNYNDVNYNTGDILGNTTAPARTNYNFIGWYDAPTNGNKVSSNYQISANTDLYAYWKKIVCKKVTSSSNLNTETCVGSAGCATSGTGFSTSSPNNVITYGTIYGNGSPKAGDAFDCDVYYDSNTDNYDQTDNYGKHIERFYFVKEKENQGSENTAVLMYYTSYDDVNLRVDSQHTPQNDIKSSSYNTSITWLPTSSTWTNPGLIDFNNNGKISRFLTVDELETVCGSLPANKEASATYFTTCFSNSHNWFLFENSKFQSSSLGADGIWLETDGNKYYRIQTSTLELNSYSIQNGGDNMARPVIEIPMSALDGYDSRDHFKIDFETYGGSNVSSIWKYDGDTLGQLATPTKDFHNFDGWYASYNNGTYSNLVTSSTVVASNMTLHAKWTKRPTNFVTFNANGQGATVNGQSSITLEVETGDSFSTLPIPSWGVNNFGGWYKDNNTFQVPFTTSDTVSTDFVVYAKWVTGDFVARVNGVSYETIAAAINAVPTTGEKTRVTLLQDITINSTIEIPSTKYIEFDGGSYTLTGASAVVFTNNGKLDVISGTYTSSGANLIECGVDSILNISDGTFSTSYQRLINTADGAIVNISNGTFSNTSSASNNVLEIGLSSIVTITDGNFSNTSQGAVINNRLGGTLNISGGRIIGSNSSKGQAIYMELANSTTNISGTAYIENKSNSTNDETKRAAVDNAGGTLVITGGTIVSTQYIAVSNRGANSTTIIGTNDDYIDITTPVMRGKTYGLERTNGTVSVYDGIFESETNSPAYSGTIANKPNVNWHNTTIMDGPNSYYATYLFSPTYTVYFYPENGDSVISKVIDNGTTISTDMPTDPTKPGYYFDGWYDTNGNQVTSSTVVTSRIEAHARWVQSVSNGTLNTMVVGVSKTSQIAFAESDIENATYSSSDTSVATVSASGLVTGVSVGTATITLTGTYSNDTKTVTVNVKLFHTVTFDEANGNPTTIIEVEDNTSIGVLMPGTPTKTGYFFDGWYDGNDNLIASGTTVNSTMTVTAKWVRSVSNATISPIVVEMGDTSQITFAENDIEDVTYLSNDTSIATVSSSGLVTGVSDGQTTITLTGSKSNDTKTVNVTVNNYYVVRFNPDNGSQVIIQNVVPGDTIENYIPANNPTKSGYIFDNWYLVESNTLTTEIDSSDVILANREYKARWASSTTVCKMDDTHYNSIKTAIDASDNTEKTIKMLVNLTALKTQISIPSTKNIILDLNGHSITYSGSENAAVVDGTLEIRNGTLTSSTRSGTINVNSTGTLIVDGVILGNTNQRQAIYNDGGTTTVRGNSELTANTDGNYNGVDRGTITNVSGNLTIASGTITNNHSNGPAVAVDSDTVTIGLSDGVISTTNPVLKGGTYGLYIKPGATVNVTVNDGLFKGITAGINDTSRTTKPNGTTYDTTHTEVISNNTYQLAYLVSTALTLSSVSAPRPASYTVTFESVGGEISPTTATVISGSEITSNDLPSTVSWGDKTFSGWYKDKKFTNAVVPGTTEVTGNVTYYAKWVYTPSNPLVTFNSTNDAMATYFSNISSWKNLSESNFMSQMSSNFSNKGCSSCNNPNGCSSPTSGTYCDQPKSYNTNVGSALKVYLYDEVNHVIGKEVNYANASSGTISNLIPGQAYYWEKESDSSVNGLVKFTSPRRVLNAGNIRNVRDLGGMSVDTDGDGTVDGKLKYGRLLRGAKLTSSSDDITSLTNLGITREVDLRPDSERGNSQHLSSYDHGNGDIIIHNYLINRDALPYSYLDGDGVQQSTVEAHTSNASELKAALKATMQYIIAGDNVYVHSTTGADRTGILAYFLEGLLGVSEENRLEDYELTYFFGLTNRTRYHDHLSDSDTNPRFKFMHDTYPTNQAIYNWFIDGDNASELASDNQLITNFRNAMINYN